MAAQQRLNNMADNRFCKQSTLQNLDRIIRDHSAFAQSYRMMHDVEQECINEAAAGHTEAPEVRMIFDQQRTLDRRRYVSTLFYSTVNTINTIKSF